MTQTPPSIDPILDKKDEFLKSLGYSPKLYSSLRGLWEWYGPNGVSSNGALGSEQEAIEDAWLTLCAACISGYKLSDAQWDAMDLDQQIGLLAQRNETSAQKAIRFFDELMANTESLAELGTQFDVATLADVCYLQAAILKEESIDVRPDSQILTVLKDLTSSGDEWRDVYTNEYDEDDKLVRRATNNPVLVETPVDSPS